MTLKVGVIGSASSKMTEHHKILARDLGQAGARLALVDVTQPSAELQRDIGGAGHMLSVEWISPKSMAEELGLPKKHVYKESLKI